MAAERPIGLVVTYTRAFYALRDCCCIIAESHGEEFALEWGKRVLEADIGLFCRVEPDRRPQLRVIRGGR